MQTDPIGYEDQMNLYAYVHNDPLTYHDPSGKIAQVVVVAAAVYCRVNKGCADAVADGLTAVAEKAIEIFTEENVEGSTGNSKKKYKNKRRSSEQRKFRQQSIENNKANNNGDLNCEGCNKPLRENTGKVGKGEKVPDDQAQAHHKDGNRENNNADTNGQILCPECHKEEHQNN